MASLSRSKAANSLERLNSGAEKACKFRWQSQRTLKGTEAALQDSLSSLRPAEDQISENGRRCVTCIQAFLFLVFFPLGISLYYYNKIFGPSLMVSSAVASAWWVNFLAIMFILP